MIIRSVTFIDSMQLQFEALCFTRSATRRLRRSSHAARRSRCLRFALVRVTRAGSATYKRRPGYKLRRTSDDSSAAVASTVTLKRSATVTSVSPCSILYIVSRPLLDSQQGATGITERICRGKIFSRFQLVYEHDLGNTSRDSHASNRFQRFSRRHFVKPPLIALVHRDLTNTLFVEILGACRQMQLERRIRRSAHPQQAGFRSATSCTGAPQHIRHQAQVDAVVYGDRVAQQRRIRGERLQPILLRISSP